MSYRRSALLLFVDLRPIFLINPALLTIVFSRKTPYTVFLTFNYFATNIAKIADRHDYYTEAVS